MGIQIESKVSYMIISREKKGQQYEIQKNKNQKPKTITKNNNKKQGPTRRSLFPAASRGSFTEGLRHQGL